MAGSYPAQAEYDSNAIGILIPETWKRSLRLKRVTRSLPVLGASQAGLKIVIVEVWTDEND
jgi:hypothetical protein